MKHKRFPALAAALLLLIMVIYTHCDCDKHITKPDEQRPEGWIAMGLENLWIQQIKLIDDWLYACTTPTGLLRTKSNSGLDNDWHYLGLGNLRVQYDLGLMDVIANDDTLIACIAGGHYTVPGFFRSVDDGRTWIKSDSGSYQGNYLTVIPNIMRMNQYTLNPRYILAVGLGLIYLSADFGLSWTLLLRESGSMAFFACAFHPFNTEELWVGGQTTMDWPVLYRSLDGGSNWEEVLKYPREGQIADCVNDIVFDPRDGNPMYLCMNYNIFMTTNSGQTWTISDSIKDVFFTLDINPHNPEELLASAAYDIYRSVDGGNNWTVYIPGLKDKTMCDMAVDWDRRIIYVITFQKYIALSTGVYKFLF